MVLFAFSLALVGIGLKLLFTPLPDSPPPLPKDDLHTPLLQPTSPPQSPPHSPSSFSWDMV